MPKSKYSGNEFLIRKGKEACLLIHGLSSSTQEIEELALFLADAGYTVKAPLLPGHNAGLDDFHASDHKGWYASVKSAYDELAAYDKRHVIGLSFGAALALKLAAEKKVATITALAPAIFFTDRKAKFSHVFKHIISFKRKDYRKFYPHRKEAPWDIVDDKAYDDRIAYKDVSLKALSSSLKFISLVKKDLRKITAPALVIHSVKDHTILPKSSSYIYENISSVNKKMFWLHGSGHVITVDKEKHIVFKEVLDFIKKF